MKKSLGNHHEVAHVWAAQTQSEGYGSNMLFNGPSIYSYGTHFEIARIVKPGVVLFNNRSYSVSTSKHQGRARSAVSHMKTFHVPSMTDHNENAAYLLEGLDTELLRISRMRKDGEFWLERYAVQAAEAMDYTRIFKVRKALVAKITAAYEKRENPLTAEQLAKFKVRIEADKARAKAERAERAAKQAARKLELQADYDGWKRGTVERLGWEAVNLFPVALRVKDDVIETTKGAAVPVIEARKLWRALRTDAGAVPGMRVGHYTVTRLDPEGGNLVIGCHTIPMREVARMAVTLGLESEAA